MCRKSARKFEYNENSYLSCARCPPDTARVHLPIRRIRQSRVAWSIAARWIHSPVPTHRRRCPFRFRLALRPGIIEWQWLVWSQSVHRGGKNKRASAAKTDSLRCGLGFVRQKERLGSCAFFVWGEWCARDLLKCELRKHCTLVSRVCSLMKKMYRSGAVKVDSREIIKFIWMIFGSFSKCAVCASAAWLSPASDVFAGYGDSSERRRFNRK